MKWTIITGMVFLAGISGQASADCTNNRINGGNNLRSLLSGNTVCGQRGTGPTREQWQEEHMTSGQLWDFKLGDGHAVDPRKQVGTWSASNGANADVSYSYTGGATSGPYLVYRVGTTDRYSFCSGGAEVVQIRLQSGTGAGCTSY